MRRRCALLAVCFALLAADSRRVAAMTRVMRVFDQSHGLPTDTINGLAQDATGFLWIATPGGLVRYDGVQMRRCPTLEGAALVRTSPSGETVAVDLRGSAWRVDTLDPSRLAGPDGALRGVRDLVYDAGGGLWVIAGDYVLYRSPQQAWSTIARDRFRGETLAHVRADGDRALILTEAAVWSVDASGAATPLLATSYPFDALRRRDGTLAVLARNVVYVQRGTDWIVAHERPARGIALAERGTALWAAYDRFLVRISDRGVISAIGPTDDLPSAGPVLVDREGSLWVASFRGLLQFPEPDAVAWSERDGLPSTHTRFIARNADGLWVSTWGGLARLLSADATSPVGPRASHIRELCVDGAGAIWFGDQGRLVSVAAGGGTRVVPGQSYRWCTRSADGGLWLGSGSVLLKTSGGRAAVVAGPPLLDAIAPRLEDRDGTLWASAGSTLCRARLATAAPTEWQCELMPGGAEIESIAQSRDGHIWIGTRRDGVFRHVNGAPVQVPASRALGGGHIASLRASRTEGVWILGFGNPQRVRAAGDPSAWEVLETLSGWHGHPTGGASDLLEDDDGSVWTTTAAGLVRIPASARHADAPAPSVELASVSVDGALVSPASPLPLAHRRNVVELRFAALTFRDRSRVRYQTRLATGPWSDAPGEPVFRYPALPAGQYVVDVRASLDGVHWSAHPARFAFDVNAPWYRRAWFVAAVSAVIVLALLAAHRVRVAMLVNLERQRTRIAMDLHDELGSGLGSIGVLAGLAATDRVNEHDRRALSSEIADTATELGGSLDDIVWSLRRGGASVQSLAEHLAERAARLFPSPPPAVTLRFPRAWPAVEVDPAVRRNLQLIVAEALHNAARHARAQQVVLGLERTGARWTAWVEDDGIGCRSDDASPGLGRETMRRRADEIGATFSWRSAPGAGTRVAVTFHPRTGHPAPKARP